jgi:hypothetical protein
MLNFLSGEAVQPVIVRRAKWAFALLAAATAGFLSARLHWQHQKDWASGQALTPYDCEDQVNTLIEKTGKPAVLYYYLPASPHHPLLRGFLLRQAHRHPHDAHWIMVNLTQHLHPAKEALSSIIYPLNQARIEIRFPKTELAVYETSGSDELKLVQETKGQRREVYNYGLTMLQFEAFLEEYGVIRGSDPIAGVLEVTRKAIFES